MVFSPPPGKWVDVKPTMSGSKKGKGKKGDSGKGGKGGMGGGAYGAMGGAKGYDHMQMYDPAADAGAGGGAMFMIVDPR